MSVTAVAIAAPGSSKVAGSAPSLSMVAKAASREGGRSWSGLKGEERISPLVGIGASRSQPLPGGEIKPVRWMVAPTGVLYESFDDGVRWQSVAVQEKVEFRSVSFLGKEIWVGGKGGALFESSDEGRHWRAVVPACKGVRYNRACHPGSTSICPCQACPSALSK